METPQGTTDTELVQPWEKETTDASVETAEQSLFDLLGSDPEFDGDEDRGEDPAENDGPLPDGIEEDDAGEGDDVEYDDDAGDEGEDEVSGEDDEDEDLADDEGDETYSVTVEGEDIEVSFDELLNGYSRTEYLTRTRQRESAAHKSAMSDVQTARSEYTEKLELMDQALGELNPSEPDWEQVQRENPGQFGALFAAHQKREKVRSAVAAEKTVEAERIAQDQAEKNDAYMADQFEMLKHAVPTWGKDQKVMAKDVGDIVDFAQKELGYTEQELSGVMDHRVILTLRAAMRGVEMESGGKKKLRKKQTKAKQRKRTMQPKGRSKTATSSSRRDSKRVSKHSEKVARTGKQGDAAALFNAMLEDGADL